MQEVSSVTYKIILRLPFSLLETTFLTSCVEKKSSTFPVSMQSFSSVYVLRQNTSCLDLIQMICDLGPTSLCIMSVSFLIVILFFMNFILISTTSLVHYFCSLKTKPTQIQTNSFFPLHFPQNIFISTLLLINSTKL